MANILVVDDEMGIRELLSEILYDEGHVVMLAENAEQARNARNTARPDMVLLDIWMPDTDGVTLLKEWALNGQLNMPVVMMSGHASIDTAVEATRIGALDFLEKPITLQKLLHTVKQGLLKSAPLNIKEVVSHSKPETPVGMVTANRMDELLPSIELVTSLSIELSELESELASLDLEMSLREVRDAFERIYFQYHLQKEAANITRVAEKTGLERTHLYRKLKQLNILIHKPSKKSNTFE
jgi:DNA-binding NtrC family response regulator